MPPSFYPRTDMKDDIFERHNGHFKTGVLSSSIDVWNTTPRGTLLAPKSSARWPTMAALQWFQSLQQQWQNLPRTPVQPFVPFSEFSGMVDETLEQHAERVEDTILLDANEREMNLEESLLENNDERRENDGRSELLYLDHSHDYSFENEPPDTSVIDFSVNESLDFSIRGGGEDVLNVTTSTGSSSLQEQIECLHQSMEESKERLLRTQTQLEQHIELLKRRQLRNHRDAMILLRRHYGSAPTLPGTSSP